MPIRDAMQNQAPADEAMTADAAAPEAQAEGGKSPIAEIMVLNAMEFLHEEANAQRIVQQAQQMEPAQVAANTLMTLMEGMAQSAKKAGQEPQPQDVIQASQDVAMEIADIFEAAGIIEEAQQEGFARQTVEVFATKIDEFSQRQGGQAQQAAGPGQPAAPAQPGRGMIGQAMGG